MATSFESHVKPYFTPCYRAHMLTAAGIDPIDLWDLEVVKNEWDDIKTEVESNRMPRQGCGEGIWDSKTRGQFLKDFTAWRDGGFQP